MVDNTVVLDAGKEQTVEGRCFLRPRKQYYCSTFRKGGFRRPGAVGGALAKARGLRLKRAPQQNSVFGIKTAKASACGVTDFFQFGGRSTLVEFGAENEVQL